MQHTLDYLSRKPVDWIKLDATPIGRPLYERFGFDYECEIERWGRPGTRAVGWFSEDDLPSPLAGAERWGPHAFAALRGEPVDVLFDAPRRPAWREEA